MYIHKEGKNILFLTLVSLLIINFSAIKLFSTSKQVYFPLTALSSIFYLWVIYFFRNPSRKIVTNKKHVLAPADGKVIFIKEVYEEEYLKDSRIQVSIFMSPLNVHVNRTPIAGIIKYFKYHPGKYLIAWHPKSSTKNERTTVVVENEIGLQILFRQIAGAVARRIKFYPKEQDEVEQGAECGFIKFGSRADVFLPLDTSVKVKVGEHVQGGISVLAEI